MTALRVSTIALIYAAGRLGLPAASEAVPSGTPAPRQVVTRVSVMSDSVPGVIDLLVRFEHARGVHTWPNRFAAVAALPGFQPMVTRIDVIELSASATAGSITWPRTTVVSLLVDGRQVLLEAYTGMVQATLPLAVQGHDRVRGRLTVRYQPCDERVCYRPQVDTLSFVAEPHK